MHHVVTLIAAPGTLLSLEPVVTALGEPERLDWLEPDRAADLHYPAATEEMLQPMLQQVCSNLHLDYIVQPNENRRKNLLIADMDSTMIAQECIDELADCVGLKPHVAAITERAMRGELDFAAALRERVALLKGLPESELQRVFDQRIRFTPGAQTLIATMRAQGAYCALVSGGFTFFTERVARALGFDHHEANLLEIAGGTLAGTVREPILDKESKRAALHRLAGDRNLAVAQTLALGDGANDIPMLRDAGLGIAYHAKPLVVEMAPAALHFNDLGAVLFAQGIPRSEWVEIG